LGGELGYDGDVRPPECHRCGERFDPGDGGDQVTFRRTKDDERWYARMEEEGFVGHPPNVEWFCAAHIGVARSLEDQTLEQARRSWGVLIDL
jgi:hypothetical protein